MELAPAPLPLEAFPSDAPCPDRVRSLGRHRQVEAGEVVVREQRPPQSLYLVDAGALCLSVTAPSGLRTVVCILGPGDVFGESTLWDRPSSNGGSGLEHEFLPECRALIPCDLIVLPTGQVARSLAPDAATAYWLTVSLGRRILALQRSIARTLSLPLAERTLELLRSLAVRWGRPVQAGTKVHIPLTQEDLGAMLGATRESVNRAVRKLERAGAVRRCGRFYVLGPPEEP